MNRSNESTSERAFRFASSPAPASISSSTEMSSMICSIRRLMSWRSRRSAGRVAIGAAACSSSVVAACRTCRSVGSSPAGTSNVERAAAT